MVLLNTYYNVETLLVLSKMKISHLKSCRFSINNHIFKGWKNH